MPTVREVSEAIEEFAPRSFQEHYDNAGLQVGVPSDEVTAVLLCLDVNEDVIHEAEKRNCNLIISHHPLLFKGLKSLGDTTPTERIVRESVISGISIYSAHTNLDATWDGVSHEMAHMMDLHDLEPLESRPADTRIGMGIIGTLPAPIPAMEFLRKVKETFGVKVLRYSAASQQLVVNRVAACGGSGASLIQTAIDAGADIFITGDVKYHDFTSYAPEILIADIGHYESEIWTKKIFSRIMSERFPDLPVYFSHADRNPVGFII